MMLKFEKSQKLIQNKEKQKKMQNDPNRQNNLLRYAQLRRISFVSVGCNVYLLESRQFVG